METLSTPALTFRTSENQDNIIRKNGGGKLMQRKPFLDRPVNSKTSLTNKFSKGTHSSKNRQNSNPKKQLSEDFDGHEYLFSFKDKENYECDIWPKPAKMGTEDIIKILRNYCSNNQSTPPPSPCHDPTEIDFIFTKLPQNVEDVKYCDKILFESIDDVEIPHLDVVDSYSF